MKTIFRVLISLILVAGCIQPLNVWANTEMSDSVEIDYQGFSSPIQAEDRHVASYATGEANATLTIRSNDKKIGYIYLLFDREVGAYQVKNLETNHGMKQDEPFIHQLIPVAEYLGETSQVEFTFPESDVRIAEIYVFEEGELPNWVQDWKNPCEQADLMILSTHADDEHLFFAGTIPYYAANNYAVQIVYLTDHYDSHQRQHERLNGLWTAGVRNYPTFLRYEDAWSDSLEGAKQNLIASGYSNDDVIKSLVSVIRQFQPLVLMGQDFNGEYQHGQHMLGSHALAEAVELASQSDVYTDIPYEAHDVLKTYIHLYEKNQIVLDVDTPLDVLNGKTPFQVSQEAFKCHESQLYTWFTEWLCGTNGTITRASQIKTYSPLQFGLYRSRVGVDTTADLFENVTPYFKQVPEEPEIKPVDPVEEEPKTSNDFPILVWIGIGLMVTLVVVFLFKKRKK